MDDRPRVSRLVTAWLAVALLAQAGCGRFDPDRPRLRITNAGSTPIVDLTVLFPADRIAFGDIPPAATTPYREVPHGVYGYAAFSLVIGGVSVTQPVIDWVGEEPMEGAAFSYTLEVDPLGQFPIVRIVSVRRDD